jgi:dihydrofolate reductase
MFNWVTADGYFATPDGNLDWVVPDEEQAKVAAADIPNFDTALFGRRTYEIFEGFWGQLSSTPPARCRTPTIPGDGLGNTVP